MLPEHFEGWEDEALRAAGHGMIDLIRQYDPARPLRSQLRDGVPAAKEFIAAHQPALLVLMYKRVARAFPEVRQYEGSRRRPRKKLPTGYVPEIEIEGVPIFVFTIRRDTEHEHRVNNEELRHALLQLSILDETSQS